MDKREIQSKRFKQSLEERGLTVVEVAEATGIDLGTLMTLEKGYTKRFDFRTAQKLAEFFSRGGLPINFEWFRGKYVQKYMAPKADIVEHNESQSMLQGFVACDEQAMMVIYRCLKVAHGTHKNVFLTDQEFEALCSKFGAQKVEDAIDYKSQLKKDNKDRFSNWASDYAALHYYLNKKEREAE